MRSAISAVSIQPDRLQAEADRAQNIDVPQVADHDAFERRSTAHCYGLAKESWIGLPRSDFLGDDQRVHASVQSQPAQLLALLGPDAVRNDAQPKPVLAQRSKKRAGAGDGG